MKKLLTLVLAIVMLLLINGVHAEEATDAIHVATIENGTVIPLSDNSIQVTYPSNWGIWISTENHKLPDNTIVAFTNPEYTFTLSIAYNEFPVPAQLDEVASELSSTFKNVQQLTINGIPFIYYEYEKNNVACYSTNDSSGYSLYQFIFSPASDASNRVVAQQIAS